MGDILHTKNTKIGTIQRFRWYGIIIATQHAHPPPAYYFEAEKLGKTLTYGRAVSWVEADATVSGEGLHND